MSHRSRRLSVAADVNRARRLPRERAASGEDESRALASLPVDPDATPLEQAEEVLRTIRE